MKEGHLNLIKKTIEILDQPNYFSYSKGKADNYIRYFNQSFGDEISLIHPVLFKNFITQVLDYTPGVNIYEEISDSSGKRPDFIPQDRKTHPFVFDTKGSDTETLHDHYEQIKNYIISHGIKYGVLINMRDVDVYTPYTDHEIEDYNFKFTSLYTDFRISPKDILDKKNTQKFLKFVEAFKHRELGNDEKIKILAEMPPWSGEEHLNINNLVIALRRIVNILLQDVEFNKREILNQFSISENEERKSKIQYELFNIMIDLGHSTKDNEEPGALETYLMDENPAGLRHQAVNGFLYRVAYFAMTKILLTRIWGDIGFIEKNVLYNGDFSKSFSYWNKRISKVLSEAFSLAGERYGWLFNNENNYTWYSPSEDILIDILFILADFPLGKLDHDILGTIYENYIDAIDKKNKGQYYTPHPIVSLMWDLVGYNTQKAIWRYVKYAHGNIRRESKKIFDPATGSGSFLVEGVKRLKEYGGINFNDFKDMLDLRTAILSSFYGSEITPFAYYITEVNLLIQLTPIIKRMHELKPNFKEYPYTLGVIQNNSLQLHNPKLKLFTNEADEFKTDKHHDIIDKDKAKQKIFDRIKTSYDFDYCCANPPYIGEQKNSTIFRMTKWLYPYWNKYYTGKMDYCYWFIILGISKLREGGMLSFITQNSWLATSASDKLRKCILRYTKIKTIIDLNVIDVFDNAKGQENMIFVLERCSILQERNNNKIKLIQVNTKTTLERICDQIKKNYTKNIYEDELINIRYFEENQSYLGEKKWGFLLAKETNFIGTTNVFRLGEYCHIDIGVDTGANKIDNKKYKKFKEVIPDLKLNEGVFVLNTEEYNTLESRLEEQEKSYFFNVVNYRDIFPYGFMNKNLDVLLKITDNDKLNKLANISRHLSRLKSVLEDRAEIRRNQKRKWFAVAWPRPVIDPNNDKIICPTRTPKAVFSLAGAGFTCLSNAIVIQNKKNNKYSLYYLLSILNSTYIRNYCETNFKRIQNRYVFSKDDVSNIPIPVINNINKEKHDKLVLLVSEIINNYNLLAQYKDFFTENILLIDNTDLDIELAFDENTFLEKYESTISLRQHPDIIIQSDGIDDSNFICKSIEKKDNILVLLSKNKQRIIVKSINKNILNLLYNIINKNWLGKFWENIKEQFKLPVFLEDFEKEKADAIKNVNSLRVKISGSQNKIDLLVFVLYSISKKTQIIEDPQD